ncbi:MAG: undecaprenyldiphospho-muramoylpentapeptide beta-N-acetylglucosaminyltransferase [Patescibacteria group bacterium]
MIQQKNKNVKVLLTGGGTGGSVSPLLAVASGLRMSDVGLRTYEFLWVGTKFGPEREMVEKDGIKFIAIPSGKLRRYFSLNNFLDPFKIIAGFFKSFFIILKFKPDLIMTAGAFVSVPIVWAGWVLRVPILVHQQDVRPGLANKLMALFARVVTVTFEESLASYGKKAVWTGNPVRFQISDFRFQIDEFCKKYGLKRNLPIVLVVGGGTGAEAINKLVWESLDELVKICQIIHITGKKKGIRNQESGIRNYVSYDFLEHEKVMGIMQAADLVVSRAGLGFLTEISYLGKPAIIIPIPDSHQEDNAQVFVKDEAAIILDQKKLTAKDFANKIGELLKDETLRRKLSNNVAEVMKKGANEAIAKIVELVARNA